MEEDRALKVLGTPERELRRRLLHPTQAGATWNHEETDKGSEQQQQPTVPRATESPPDESLTSLSAAPQAPTHTPSSIDTIIAVVYHFIAAFFYIYMGLHSDMVLAGLKRDHNLIVPESDKYGGMWKFLAYINFHIQTGYFVLALLCDLVPWSRKALQKFIDFTFTTVVFPCALLVSASFWFFTTFLREYSVGTADDPLSTVLDTLPPYIQHTWYTAVSFGVVIEALLVFHRHTSTSDGMKTMFIWNSSYAFWIYWCYYHADTLPYPLFTNLGPYLLPLAFIVSVLFYFCGKVLTLWSWAGEE